MKRECDLCRQSFLSKCVQKRHDNMAVCLACEKALTEIVKERLRIT